MDDAVFHVDGAVIRLARSSAAQPAADGQDDETDHRHADRNGQENQAQQKAECEDADTEKDQPQPRKRAGRRLIESLPWILHKRTDPVSASVFLCPAGELVEGRYREFSIECGGQPVYLLATRHEGHPRAWLNVCPHQGRPLNWAPDRFLTDPQGRVVCGHHGAVFEPEGGQCVSGPCVNASLRAVSLVEADDGVRAICPE